MTPALVDGQWQVPTRFNFGRDVVEQWAIDNQQRPAMTFVDTIGAIRRLTYHDVALGAARWSGFLSDQGLGRGDRLLVVAGKTPEWHMVLLGALRLGAIAIPCPELLRAKDLAFRASHSAAALVVAHPSGEAELRGMASLLDNPPPVLYLDEAAPLVADRRPLACVDTKSDEPAFILYTSGTTKEPKGVTHTHGYTFATRLQAEYWLDARPNDLVWCTAGAGWAKSIWNVLLGPWSCGAEIVVHEGGFDPVERFALLERLEVDVLCQAPTEYRLMAKLDGLEHYDLSRLRHAVSAGEPLNPEVIHRFREAFGLTVYDGYGQTENTLLVANAPGATIRPGSMGLPTPGHDVAVIDDSGEPVAPGVEGDIALRGRTPSLFAGYWAAPEETDATFRGDWYLTGDRGTRDPDGYFWFTGRSDDVILSAAYRIGPFEVESALLEHPAVAESAVVGKPDADRGQIVKAFVVLRPEAAASDELATELQDHCKRVTAPYKYPREIEFVESLPKTRSGKIRRVELRQLEQERAREGRTGRPAPILAQARVPGQVPGPSLVLPPQPDLPAAVEQEPVPVASQFETRADASQSAVDEQSRSAEPEPVATEPEPEPEPEPGPGAPRPPSPPRPSFEAWPEPASTHPAEPEPEPELEPEPDAEPELELEVEPELAATPDPANGSSLIARLRAYERRPGEDTPPGSPFARRFERDAEDDAER